MTYVFMIFLFLTAVFLILLILVQRGKGGGLAGAFGGLGGQSAFGTKAGDTFTRITIGVAAFWILLCILSVRMLTTSGGRLDVGSGNAPAGQRAETEGDGGNTGGASQDSTGGAAPSSGTESTADGGQPSDSPRSGGS